MKRLALFSRWLLGICVVSLTSLGVVMLYSTTSASLGEGMLKQQTLWISLGAVVGTITYFVGYERLCRWRKLLLFLVIVPLIYLAIAHGLYKFVSKELALPFAPLRNGAHRWIELGGRQLQPSEFAKLIIVIYLAGLYAARPNFILKLRSWYRPVFLVIATIGLIFSGGSLSMTVICMGVLTGMLFVCGLRLRYLALPCMLAGAAILFSLVTNPNRLSRMMSFLEPEEHLQGSGYQLHQSQMALGSGHWTGVGFNQSRMKEQYLPEAHTDFIVSIIGEELGFVAVLGVILTYLLLAGAAFGIAASCQDSGGQVLAVGLGLILWIPSCINIAVVTGCFPTTGISAPLLSYGGSGVLVTSITVGLLLSVARRSLRILDEPEPVPPRGPAPKSALVPA